MSVTAKEQADRFMRLLPNDLHAMANRWDGEGYEEFHPLGNIWCSPQSGVMFGDRDYGVELLFEEGEDHCMAWTVYDGGQWQVKSSNFKICKALPVSLIADIRAVMGLEECKCR